MYSEHDRLVKSFFEKIKREQPEKYKEVCEKYPVITPESQRTIDQREVTAGLVVTRETE